MELQYIIKNNTLKVIIVFAKFLGPDIAFHDLEKRANNTIVRYKRKPLESDQEKRWITTWNHYLHKMAA